MHQDKQVAYRFPQILWCLTVKSPSPTSDTEVRASSFNRRIIFCPTHLKKPSLLSQQGQELVPGLRLQTNWVPILTPLQLTFSVLQLPHLHNRNGVAIAHSEGCNVNHPRQLILVVPHVLGCLEAAQGSCLIKRNTPAFGRHRQADLCAFKTSWSEPNKDKEPRQSLWITVLFPVKFENDDAIF